MLNGTLTVDSLKIDGQARTLTMPVFKNSAKVQITMTPIDEETVDYHCRLTGENETGTLDVELKRMVLPMEHAVNEWNAWAEMV